MKVLFLGGIFSSVHNEEIISKTRTYVEYAANNFQKKIIDGLEEIGVDVDVISAPFLGAFPQAYKEWYFKGFNPKVSDNSGYKYVNFINIWGIRNFSRKNAIKNSLKEFIELDEKEKLIIVYSPHTPFLQAAVYAKKRDKRIKICLVVPDLPQYMNLSDKISLTYKILKRIDINIFLKDNKMVDSYVILTKFMAENLKIEERPYCVVEGIYEEKKNEEIEKNENNIKTVVYTGKLNASFGIINLVKAFMKIENINYRLLICGDGEERENIIKASKLDNRIIYKGQVSSEEARRYINLGDLLVNPRQNNSEYTKYSFPSKIIDYLTTGNPVIAYKLDGMPKIYEEFIYFAPDNTIETLKNVIIKVMDDSLEEKLKRHNKALCYLKNNLSKDKIAKKIIEMNFDDVIK